MPILKFMNKLFIPVIAIVALCSFAACSTKFNTAAPYKNITVIYGLLDQADTAHYIRIQKAFLDNNKSALTMAQVADSNFYANLNVKIERINSGSGIGNGVHDTIHLNRVDLDLEGYPKQPGVFFTSPNYAYKFKGVLDPTYTYRIVVSNPVTGEVDSAETPIIVDNDASVFNIGDLDDSNKKRAGLDFYSVIINNNNVLDINGSYTAPNGFSFEGLNTPVELAELIIRFNWVDSNITNQAKTAHYYDYDLGFQVPVKGIFDYSINNIDLFSAIKAGMGTAPANTIRLIDKCTLFAYYSTHDYHVYENLAQTAGTGLTGSEIEPLYTNIQGANVLGLYTSKAVRSGTIGITLRTVDSLIASPILQGTNLKGTAY